MYLIDKLKLDYYLVLINIFILYNFFIFFKNL